MKSTVQKATPKMLLADLRQLIAEARQDVARQVNSTLVLLYWRVGQRIRRDILKERRAEYGEQIVAAVGRQLEMEFGRGYGEKNLRRMIQFGEVFPDEKIVVALIRQLSWTHFLRLIPIHDPFKRDFYVEMCRMEGWNTRTLHKKIGSLLYERTALSKKPDALIRHELDQLRTEDKLTPDLVFRDPYFLDFLSLKDRYLEKDLEDAIMRELENFILELGVGFTFVARQKRVQVDNDDYYLDLLFYHRGLRPHSGSCDRDLRRPLQFPKNGTYSKLKLTECHPCQTSPRYASTTPKAWRTTMRFEPSSITPTKK